MLIHSYLHSFPQFFRVTLRLLISPVIVNEAADLLSNIVNLQFTWKLGSYFNFIQNKFEHKKFIENVKSNFENNIKNNYQLFTIIL